MKLIAFPFHDWRKSQSEGFRTRDGHLMQEFARLPGVDELIVVNRPVPRIESLVRRSSQPADPIISRHSSGRFNATVRLADARTVTVDITTPDVLGPVIRGRGWWFTVFANRDVINLIQWAAEDRGASGAPTIAWVPAVSETVLALEPSKLVFDSLDNWLLHPVLRRQADQARSSYSQLLPAADRVVVAAPRSAQVLSQWRDDIEIVPNGVDSKYFAQRHPRPDDLPSAPIVGYAGKLAQRIDVELIVDVARSMAATNFVFLGPVLEPAAIRPLRGVQNVHLLGDRSYADLPRYLSHFDVGWIPHRVGEGETGGDPIKLYEYWAAGLPVVSTRIDGMDRWSNEAALITSSAEAKAAIERMLSHPVVPKIPPDREWPAIASHLMRGIIDVGGS